MPNVNRLQFCQSELSTLPLQIFCSEPRVKPNYLVDHFKLYLVLIASKNPFLSLVLCNFIAGSRA